MPSGNEVAAGRMVAFTFAPGPPAASVPFSGEMLSHAQVLITDQFSVLEPVLVSTNEAGFGSNGPPTGPPADRFSTGRISRSSGMSKASTIPDVVELGGEVALTP